MQHGPRAVPQMNRTEGVPHQETDAERIGAVSGFHRQMGERPFLV